MDGFSFDANGEEIDIADALCDHFFNETEEEKHWDEEFEQLPEEDCGYDPMDPNGIGDE